MTGNTAEFDLERFVKAQEDVYATVLAQLKAGRKTTHWIWFIFPQIAGLGFSSTAQFYAISSKAEAEAYLGHPVLGKRLDECVRLMLAQDRKTAHDILGSPDDLKFCSCLTLFDAISPEGSVFEEALERFYNGRPDPKTLALLDGSPSGSL